MRIRQAATLVGTAALLLAAAPTAAHATPTAGCSVNLGSVTAAGVHTFRGSNSTTVQNTPGVFGPGRVKLSTTFTEDPRDVVGSPNAWSYRTGYVVLGDTLAGVSYSTKPDGTVSDLTTNPISEGFSGYTAIEWSRYGTLELGGIRNTFYALRADGTLERRAIDKSWAVNGTYAGLKGIKAITLISATASYDTFLATTRAGGLYTLHIPVSAPMKPVVKTVRASTWQGFETLIAGRCGTNGTVLVGIDKDTNKGTVYQVGHANGTATTIKSLGALPGDASAPVNFRWAPEIDSLRGE